MRLVHDPRARRRDRARHGALAVRLQLARRAGEGRRASRGSSTAAGSRAVQEQAPVPDYAFPGVDDARLATALAGFAGTLGVFVLGAGVVAVVRRRPRTA